ncbi:MAG TPA: hypothetical protein VM253_08145 [Candidatus Limnocylindrales bacterium]|nr:hypothetical protein [Candidatus Limnocylindrales bacterium]
MPLPRAPMRLMRIVGVSILVAGLAACGPVTRLESPDPAAVPTGPIEARGAGATGPIVELGSGEALGTAWRYAIYPSEDGWCTQLETADLTSTGCGEILPEGDDAFGGVVRGGGDGTQLSVVEGLVSDETATVWLIADGGTGRRIPAMLMPLDEAGLDAQAFLGFAPADMNVTHVMAVAWNGRVLQTYELP